MVGVRLKDCGAALRFRLLVVVFAKSPPNRGVLMPELLSSVVASVRLSAGVGGTVGFFAICVAAATKACSSTKASYRASISADIVVQKSCASGLSTWWSWQLGHLM